MWVMSPELKDVTIEWSFGVFGAVVALPRGVKAVFIVRVRYYPRV